MDGHTSRDAEKFMVRFPPGMRQRIAIIAAQNNRSMNAEVVARLEATLERDEAKGMSHEEIAAKLEDVLRRIEQLEQRP